MGTPNQRARTMRLSNPKLSYPMTVLLAVAGLAAATARAETLEELVAPGGLSGGTACVIAADSWEFRPFSARPDAPQILNLRSLNEERAGQAGFVRVSADGNSLLRGDGQPIRFWAVNMAKPENFDRDKLLDHLRWLATMGCNMIRWNYVDFNSRAPGAKPADVDDEEIADIQRAVDEAAKLGIYSYLLTGGALHSFEGVELGKWGIEGFDGPCAGLGEAKGLKPFGLVYINPVFQRAYKTWLKELLTRPNPQTGVPLVKNPALAVVQYLSEDSLLFYTFNKIPQPQLRLLGQRYADWLTAKYGSLPKATAAWGLPDGQSPKLLLPDDFARGVAGFFYINAAVAPALDQLPASARARLADQIEFLSATMRAFYADVTGYLKNDLGGRFLIMPGNWRPADTTLLLDAERWTYTAGDVVGKNLFFPPARSRDRSALAALSEPLDVPLVIKHVEGQPMFLSATTYFGPNAFQIEEAFLAAAYGSLSGLDGISFEAFYRDKHLRDAEKVSPSPAQPNQAWTWPAAALIYRQHLVREGDVALRENRRGTDLWREQPPQFAEFPRTNDVAPFFVGPVRCQYEPFTQPAITNCESFIDRKIGVIRSVTGELSLNYRTPLCVIDTPHAQAVYGSLAGHSPIQLRDATIACENALAAVYLVSMDGRPLATSSRILVQVHTPASVAGNHWRVPKARVSVTVRNPALQRVRYLDVEGRVLSSGPLSRGKSEMAFSWNADAFHAVLENEP